MSAPEIIPPHETDEEARWREACRQSAVRCRILQEEFERAMPTPPLYSLPGMSRWWWGAPILAVVCGILIGAGIAVLASLPPTPIHVIVTQGP